MRRAGHKRTVSLHRAPTTPPVGSLNAIAVAIPLMDEQLPPSAEAIAAICAEKSESRGTHRHALEIAIQQRIESRLPGRVRNLLVRVFGDLVILEGQCTTYYTKQLAQHAAMGILEDEHLENAIVVSMPQ